MVVSQANRKNTWEVSVMIPMYRVEDRSEHRRDSSRSGRKPRGDPQGKPEGVVDRGVGNDGRAAGWSLRTWYRRLPLEPRFLLRNRGGLLDLLIGNLS